MKNNEITSFLNMLLFSTGLFTGNQSLVDKILSQLKISDDIKFESIKSRNLQEIKRLIINIINSISLETINEFSKLGRYGSQFVELNFEELSENMKVFYSHFILVSLLENYFEEDEREFSDDLIQMKLKAKINNAKLWKKIEELLMYEEYQFFQDLHLLYIETDSDVEMFELVNYLYNNLNNKLLYSKKEEKVLEHLKNLIELHYQSRINMLVNNKDQIEWRVMEDDKK